MQLLLSYGIPIALVLIGGQVGNIYGQQFLGSILGLILAIGYLSIIMKGDLTMMKGTKAIRRGNIAEGVAYYEKALSHKLKSEYVIYAAYAFLRYGYEDKCVEALKKADTLKNLTLSQKKELLTTKGLYHWRTGDMSAAEACFREAHELGADSQTYSHVGFILMEAGKFDEAYEFNKEALDYNEDDASIADNMAMSHYYRGEFSEAVGLYEKIMERGTRFPVVYYNYALCLEKLNRLSDAKEQLETALHYQYSHIASVSKETVEKKLEEIMTQLS